MPAVEEGEVIFLANIFREEVKKERKLNCRMCRISKTEMVGNPS